MIKGYFLSSMYTPQKAVYFDDSNDFEALELYAKEHSLVMGSLAICCADGSEYLLDSRGKWHKKTGGAR